MLRLRTMDDIRLDGRVVLVRVDFNVSLGSDGEVDQYEDYRIEAALPTIQELQRQRCKILLLTHLGRPTTTSVDTPSDDLVPVQRRLEKLLGDNVHLGTSLAGPGVTKALATLQPGRILMLPNVRCDPREETGDAKLAQEWARLATVYINEAFSVSHRPHTSVATLPRLLLAAAGRRTIQEVTALSTLQERPPHPYVAIISGAKIVTKIALLKALLDKVDHLCVAGQIANVFLQALGHYTDAAFSGEEVNAAKKLWAGAQNKICLPVDVTIGPAEPQGDKDVHVVAVDELPKNIAGVWDIGPKSVANIIKLAQSAEAVLWNGPVGRCEVKPYDTSSVALATALRRMPAYRVVGGGDTVNLLERLNMVKHFDHVSVGGGAMVAFLEGAPMPGLVPLYA